MELNGFYNYDIHIPIPQNTEGGEPELNNAGGKFQDNNELILYNTIIKSGRNQIYDMMKDFVSPFQDS